MVRGDVGAREVLLLVGDAVGGGKAYHLPKGHVCVDETLEETVRREVLEESGVSVELFGYIGALTWEFGEDKTKTIKTIHYYLATFKSDTGVHDSEYDSVEWIPLAAAAKALATNIKGEDKIIDRAVKLISELHG